MCPCFFFFFSSLKSAAPPPPHLLSGASPPLVSLMQGPVVPDNQAVYKDSVFRLLEKFTEECGGNGQVVQPGEGLGAARCGCGQVPPHHFKLGDFAEQARDSCRTYPRPHTHSCTTRKRLPPRPLSRRPHCTHSPPSHGRLSR